MLQSLKIEGFRGFQSFEMANLGRINLLVGKNNSGKTSILEAILIYVSKLDIGKIQKIFNHRGEYSHREIDAANLLGGKVQSYDIKNLFYKYLLKDNQKIVIYEPDKPANRVILSIQCTSKELLSKVNKNNLQAIGSFCLVVEFEHQEKVYSLSPEGEILQINLNDKKPSQDFKKLKLFWIAPQSIAVNTNRYFFSQSLLNSTDNLVIEALKIIEPKIEKIATTEEFQQSPFNPEWVGRGGFMVKLAGAEEPVSIGSLGDGIWRMLGLVLAMVNLENGILLVDEIDSGLHFTVMTDMWKVVWEIAKKLNIQVFATTHSRDCWQSLAELITEEKITDNEITIQRIDREKSQSVIFDPEEIVIAAKSNLEVR
ncbi:MAG: AAA family ATPase [Microcystis sp. M038S2]|uniref:AAA family ATPase n=1 Tax=unclassified Microcystis TaxID=2643300 RepID=UPI00258B3373|nr:MULTISPECIES: ATP-binding protein [unclassified Microcystis]MCA2682566.1 AAA family ATPase [Microcystis sp. M046S2]MCA2706681.1 AAA family ATPase [Microcystis sp. M038S2]MCA2946988.1 AAA family ATPase [Microcystis sp. M109S1]MCA2953874.1 AAA family ATPase [Microcystis sp. M112S1]